MENLLQAIDKTFTTNQIELNESLNYFETVSLNNFPWLVSTLADIICVQGTSKQIEIGMVFKHSMISRAPQEFDMSILIQNYNSTFITFANILPRPKINQNDF